MRSSDTTGPRHRVARHQATLAAAALALGTALGACTDQPTSPAPVPAAARPTLARAAAASPTILFSGSQSGTPKLYVMDADGANVRPVTSGPGIDEMPDYAPGNKRIAWVRRTEPLGPGAIMTALANGSKAAELVPNTRQPGNPRFSPDGTKIAFDAKVLTEPTPTRAVFTMSLDGTNLTRITFGTGTRAAGPSWSPDGTEIAYASNELGGDIFSIFTVNVISGDAVLRVNCYRGSGCAQPAWSPDGKQIVFTDLYDGRLYRLVLESASMTRVGSDIGGVSMRPAWSTDGSRILFSNSSLGTFDIYSISPDDAVGSTRVRLTSTLGDELYAAASR